MWLYNVFFFNRLSILKPVRCVHTCNTQRDAGSLRTALDLVTPRVGDKHTRARLGFFGQRVVSSSVINQS